MLNDGITDNNTLLFKDYYQESGYPWFISFDFGAWHSAYSVSVNSDQIVAMHKLYFPIGCKWRDAIRNAEISGVNVPSWVYNHLRTLRKDYAQN